MKHRFTIIAAFLLFLLRCLETQAQTPFPASHERAEWGVEIVEIGGINFPRAERIQFASDTVINGTTYAKYNGLLFYTNAPSLPRSPFGFLIRVQGQKVYERRGNRDRLLYDFSLQPGDSVWLPSTTDSTGRDSVLTYVDSITTEVNQGISRRMFHLTYPSHDPMGVTYAWPSAWIEGVGSVEGPTYRLNRYNSPWTDNTNSALVCMRKGGVMSYLRNAFISCPTILSTEEPEARELPLLDVAVFPNPGLGETLLRYQTAAPGQVKIAVCDVLGRQHFIQQQYQPPGAYQLALFTLPKGIYLVTVEANGQRQMQRLVME